VVTSDPLKQNPHAVRDTREKNLELAIGRQIRELRKRQRMTGAELAGQAGLSVGALSKIENGLVSPSLATLQSLADSLRVPIPQLFSGFDQPRRAMHVKASQGVDVKRQGSRAGHQYSLLGHIGSNESGVVVEPYLLTLTDETDTFPVFQHEGIEMIYMLEGVLEYRHGDSLYLLEPGDSFLFDSDAPHGPERHVERPIRYLSIICYPQ